MLVSGCKWSVVVARSSMTAVSTTKSKNALLGTIQMWEPRYKSQQNSKSGNLLLCIWTLGKQPFYDGINSVMGLYFDENIKKVPTEIAVLLLIKICYQFILNAGVGVFPLVQVKVVKIGLNH